jgi:hypothetical protein
MDRQTDRQTDGKTEEQYTISHLNRISMIRSTLSKQGRQTEGQKNREREKDVETERRII